MVSSAVPLDSCIDDLQIVKSKTGCNRFKKRIVNPISTKWKKKSGTTKERPGDQRTCIAWDYASCIILHESTPGPHFPLRTNYKMKTNSSPI